jgi:hypothetical protein
MIVFGAIQDSTTITGTNNVPSFLQQVYTAKVKRDRKKDK